MEEEVLVGIELGGAFPAVDRLFPQTPLRYLDAEFDLFLGLTPLLGPRMWSRRHDHEQRQNQRADRHGYYFAL